MMMYKGQRAKGADFNYKNQEGFMEEELFELRYKEDDVRGK